MPNPLAAEALMRHIHALADDIGPRQPGHAAEAQARDYIRANLAETGHTTVEEQPFTTVDTAMYGTLLPLGLAASATLLGLFGRRGQIAGGLAGLFAAASFWRYSSGGRQPLTRFSPQHPSANLIVRIAPTGQVRQRAVLVGHTDTQRYRAIFQPHLKGQLLGLTTQGLGVMALNGLAQLLRAAGLRPARFGLAMLRELDEA